MIGAIMINAYLNNYNRLSWPLSMANYLDQIKEIEVIFIDNNSTYPPLLEWYEKQNKFEVIRLTENKGHLALWNSYIYDRVDGHYILSDPDLDLSNIPLDFLDILKEGFDKYPEACKCGFSLEVNDLPNTEYGIYVHDHEDHFWNNKDLELDRYFIKSCIDTTFALYHKNRNNNNSGIRTNRPYVARHLPWYYEKGNLTEEDIYYINTATSECSAKAQMQKFL